MIKPIITGIIISAGKSGRCSGFKPLYEWEGKTFIEQVILKCLMVCERVIVVTGFKSDYIIDAVAEFLDVQMHERVKFVVNADYEKGMFTSLKKGLASQVGGEWFLYHFVDQPMIPVKFYSEFVEQIDGASNWLQPAYKGKNGHPIIFSDKIKNLIISSGDDTNLKTIRNGHDTEIKVWECEYPEVLLDIDRDEDLRRIIVK